MTAISSSVVVGFFCLTNGRRLTREHPEKKETVNSYYTSYSSSISCVNADDAFMAEIRIYSPPRDPLLPEYTVAYVMAKMHAPSNSVVLLDALQCFPFPGDPSDDGYDSIFPSNIPTFVFVLGNVPTAHTTDAIGSRLFNMNITEYVRDAPRSYVLSYVSLFYCNLHFKLYDLITGVNLMVETSDGLELDRLLRTQRLKFSGV